MEALFSQLSFLANQALDDKNFDPSKIEELLALFEQEAYGSWAAADAEHRKAADDAKVSMKEAEDYLDSLMEAAMADFRSSYDAADRTAAAELSSLERTADATQKVAKSLGSAATGASKKYMDAAMAAAVAAMKSAFASSKVHP
ncbi:hypothetical protein Cni_G17554 [Canna indica]|uniref:Uncharacterized protein n=1 Tax=Canna indica TaxID=4628 RepID=A0AAQ3KMW7_9LILI|nr:hypothetical protein Cni_G17554 [Canna indica]